MALLSALPDRAHFRLAGYEDLLSIPVSLCDKMLEQLVEWRGQEDAAFAKMKKGK